MKARHNNMADLKEIIRESLGVSSVKDLGATGGGCISNSRKFQTENGNIFVKIYEQEKVISMKNKFFIWRGGGA